MDDLASSTLLIINSASNSKREGDRQTERKRGGRKEGGREGGREGESEGKSEGKSEGGREGGRERRLPTSLKCARSLAIHEQVWVDAFLSADYLASHTEII